MYENLPPLVVLKTSKWKKTPTKTVLRQHSWNISRINMAHVNIQIISTAVSLPCYEIKFVNQLSEGRECVLLNTTSDHIGRDPLFN